VHEGLSRTQPWLRRIFAARLLPAGEVEPPKSAKSRLQEWTQRHHRQKPQYETEGVTGPPHRHAFTVAALVDGRRIAVGEGSSRQRAEEAAAASTLAILEGDAANPRDDR
jgi:ribonuclease-3